MKDTSIDDILSVIGRNKLTRQERLYLRELVKSESSEKLSKALDELSNIATILARKYLCPSDISKIISNIDEQIYDSDSIMISSCLFSGFKCQDEREIPISLSIKIPVILEKDDDEFNDIREKVDAEKKRRRERGKELVSALSLGDEATLQELYQNWYDLKVEHELKIALGWTLANSSITWGALYKRDKKLFMDMWDRFKRSHPIKNSVPTTQEQIKRGILNLEKDLGL